MILSLSFIKYFTNSSNMFDMDWPENERISNPMRMGQPFGPPEETAKFDWTSGMTLYNNDIPYNDTTNTPWNGYMHFNSG